MYKLISIDLDGTLLDSHGEISIENEKAIKMAKEKGIKIAICSGRILSSIKKICLPREIGDYLISGNGAQIYDVRKDELIYENCMNKDLALKIIKFCDENSIYYSVLAENSIITSSLSYNVLAYNNENFRKSYENKTKINLTQDVYDYIQQCEEEKFIKITLCDNNRIIFEKIVKKLKEIKGINVVEFSHMSSKTIQNGSENIGIKYYYAEVINGKVNKWEAIKHLSSILLINNDEILSFGDNINDIELIQNSGMGIAMANSTNFIKNIANHITLSNDENGVAEAIQKFIGREEK